MIDYNNSHKQNLAQYEIYINPPKGTTNNQLWAEHVSKNAIEKGFPALIVRPALATKEGNADTFDYEGSRSPNDYYPRKGDR